MIIDFLSVSIFWLALWALREVERHRRFKNLAAENEALRAANRKRAKQVETLKARESQQQLIIGVQREGLQKMLAKLKIDDEALSPASAKSESNCAAIVRVTTRLTANSAGLS